MFKIPVVYRQKKNSFDFELKDDIRQSQNDDNITKISSDIQKNKQYVQRALQADINNDIVRRDIDFAIGDKIIKAYLVYVEGLTSSESINEAILLPLMLLSLLPTTLLY